MGQVFLRLTSVSFLAPCPEASVALLPEADGRVDHEYDLRRRFLAYSINYYPTVTIKRCQNGTFQNLIKKSVNKKYHCVGNT